MQGYEVKQSSTAYPLVFLMIDSSDHLAGKTGLSPTVTISKNGGSFASPSGAVTEMANGWYKAAGNATDTATLGPLALHATATGADPTDALYPVVAVDPQDAVRYGLSALPNAAAAASGGLPTVDAANSVKIQGTIKKNTALAGFAFPMVLSDHATAATGKTITAERSLDGGAFAACANTAAEMTGGWYKIDLAAADLNGNTVALRFNSTGCDETGYTFTTQP